MRITLRSCALVVAMLMAVGNAYAQNQWNVSRTAYENYYQDEDNVASPSDVAGSCDANGCDAGDDGCGCEASCGCDSSCDSGCDSCCSWCCLGDPWTLQKCENCWGVTYGGWLQYGYHSDNTPLSFTDADGLAFNDLPGRGNLHQAWFYLEREAEGDCCCWDWGFRVDAMYGTDAQKTQAFGNDVNAAGNTTGWDNRWDNGYYGWALPQAYVSFDRGPLNIKIGHFYTLIGYEVVTAPDNFFYSHALTMFNSEPFTHTGILAEYETCCGATLYGGWTAGWDTGFDRYNNLGQEGSNFLGGISKSVSDNVSVTYILTFGDMGLRGDGYTHSIVVDWEINDCWEYVLQHDLVGLEANAVNGGLGNDQKGINQYLFYTFNDCLKLGARLEWWQTDSNVDRYAATLGLNIKPHANLTIRPEGRYDWGDGIVVPGGGAAPVAPNEEVTTFAVDAILTF